MASNTFVCEDDFDCLPHGSCGAGLSCLCDPGFSGKQCEEEVEEGCPLNCQNGGQCIIDNVHELIHENDAYCECPSGYEGGLCERVNGGARQSSQNLSSKTGRRVTGIVVGTMAAIIILAVIRRCRRKINEESSPSTEKRETASPGPEDSTLPSLA